MNSPGTDPQPHMTDASIDNPMKGDPPAQPTSASPSAIPMAVTIPATRKRPSAVWLLTFACAGLSIWLISSAYRNQGEWIEIEFEQGYGLRIADALRFRGIEIGRIEKIDLRASSPGVLVVVRLTPNARSVVTEGTRFWIERPIVSLESIQGLETVIGPKHIAMEPGKGGTATGRRFIGLEAPPPIHPKEGSVEIVLDSQQRHGLTSGAPILHRGFRVGDVLSVELASDARSVIMRAAIDPEYHELVRSNSQFWVRSGWQFELGLRGISVVADSLGEILYGGIEFATPNSQGTIAATGMRFELHDEPRDEWLNWQPSLPFGLRWNHLQSQTQPSHRIALRWKEKSFGFQVDRQRTGWALILDDGSVVCRDDLVTPPKEAISDTVSLEFAGSAQAPAEWVATSPLTDGRQWIKFARQASNLDASSLFDSSKVPLPTSAPERSMRSGENGKRKEPVDVIVLGPELSKAFILDSGRLTASPEGWRIDPKIMVPPELDSAPVLESSSGRCIGCLNVRRGVAIIALIQDLK